MLAGAATRPEEELAAACGCSCCGCGCGLGWLLGSCGRAGAVGSAGVCATSPSRSIPRGGDIRWRSSRSSVTLRAGVLQLGTAPAAGRRGVLRRSRRDPTGARGLFGKDGCKAATAARSSWAGRACWGAARAKAQRALASLQRQRFVWSCAPRARRQDQARAEVPKLSQRRLRARRGTGRRQALLQSRWSRQLPCGWWSWLRLVSYRQLQSESRLLSSPVVHCAVSFHASLVQFCCTC